MNGYPKILHAEDGVRDGLQHARPRIVGVADAVDAVRAVRAVRESAR